MKSIIQRQLEKFNKEWMGGRTFWEGGKHISKDGIKSWLTQSYKEVLSEVGKEIIGEDENPYDGKIGEFNIINDIRNCLRIKQRQKLKTIIKI